MIDVGGIGMGAIAAASDGFPYEDEVEALVRQQLPSYVHLAQAMGHRRCIGPGGEEYVRMGDRWERASEALTERVLEQRLPGEKPLSDERLIALYKERMVEALQLEKLIKARGFEPRLVYDQEDDAGGVEVWKKV